MKISPVLKYPGSKWRLAEWIISHFPPHTTYLEPFFGSGAVFFTKPQSDIETINDIDGNVTNLFKVIREHPDELATLIEFTPWARDEYYASYEFTDNQLEMARRFLVRCWQAFGTDLYRKPGWNNSKRASLRLSRNNEFQKLPQIILETAQRLKSAQIENMDAVELIKGYNYSEVLIYADPPYVMHTRSGGKRYQNEMTTKEQEELLITLIKHKGPVIISGYENESYNLLLKNWNKHTKTTTAIGGAKRDEVIWTNFEPCKNLSIFELK